MNAIGSALCAFGLLFFIIFSASYIIHRQVVLKRLIEKKLSGDWDDPDFNYEYYSMLWKNWK